jgi:DNA polymerase III psi subunit
MADAGLVDAEHLRMLDVMGIDVYALRRVDAMQTGFASAPSSIANSAAPMRSRLIVVSARGTRHDTRLARLLAQLPQIFGVDPAAIGWFEADANGELGEAPAAAAYLVLGAAMARALGAQLSTMQQNTSVIAVTADAAELPGDAGAKRALWHALKPLARCLRAGVA